MPDIDHCLPHPHPRSPAGWHDRAQWAKRMRVIATRAAARIKYRTVALAFDTWLQAVDDGKNEKVALSREELLVSR